jgi:SWI/SNF-related matrix-associated actin-dependent regulator of chromatin subfamily A member 5
MQMEKERLESRGFPQWDKREFNRFVSALEMYATDDYENISKHLEGSKSPEEVMNYCTVFMARVDDLNDSKKIKERINKAQQDVNFHLRAPEIIRKKISQYEYPLEDMVMPSSV